MNIFDKYADFYDLLYKDKNYKKEVDYICSLIKKYSSSAKTILELGCGTGIHGIFFAQSGYDVNGVDISEKMVEKANQKLESFPDLKGKISFLQEDIRSFRLNKKFDVAVSLFHVFSYQVRNEDLKNTFEAAAFHLNENGLLIFDCWYGPAVLIKQPTVCIKRAEDEDYLITRISEPKMNLDENAVEVKFQIFVQEKDSGQIDEFKELHNMRYLFKPELELMLEQVGFKILKLEEWVTGRTPNEDSWGTCFICRKIK